MQLFESDLIGFYPNDIYLQHYGTPHQGGTSHSGRYPWGSGENPYQRYKDFYSAYNNLKAQGLNENQIAEKLGIVANRYGKIVPDIGKLRAMKSNAYAEKRSLDRAQVLELKAQGLSNVEIGKQMGIGESTVRSLLNEDRAARTDLNRKTAEVLKEYVDKNRYVDIGAGTEIMLGVTNSRLDNAVALLEEDGYKKQYVLIDQMGTNHKTTIMCLTPPDCEYEELSEHKFDIKYPGQESVTLDPKGDTSGLGLSGVNSVDGKRVYIRYAEDGGLDNDGLIELRRGVDDISLGGAMYAQVRIGVDGTHYMKGMARYADDIPEGYDIVYNTNKSKGTPPEKVYKPMKGYDEDTGDDSNINWDNPFGASVTSRYYTDANGEKKLSPINVIREEGEWQQKWNNTLASQFVSKQSLSMAKRQLALDYESRKEEFEEIKALENPTVKKKLLETFGDNCDSAAVELKAAPFPGQQWHVILPYKDIKEDECYAPNYPDGTKVACVRYPHSGPSEIPILTVRNTGSPAESTIKNAPDAIGINKKTADRLSGADFDGDSVVVIPLSDKVKVRNDKVLPGMENFDPKEAYPGYPGMKVLSERNKQLEMGKTTNLIMDMSLKGANREDLALATKHSMCIIDAAKHELDYKRSEKENEIARLKSTYQDDGSGHTGAGTIITRAGSPMNVPIRKEWYPSSSTIDPDTGEKIYQHPKDNTYKIGKLKGVKIKDGGEVYVNTDKKTGELYYLTTDQSTGKKVRNYVKPEDFSRLEDKPRTQESTKMAEAKDAYTLTSGGSRENPGHPMEKIYAEYANNMKALGNESRKEWLRTGNLKYDSTAAKTYASEVESLNNKLKNAKAHAPIERQAQLQANRVMAIKKQDNPGMTKDEEKKYRGQAIVAARNRLGHKSVFEITDKEWEAIQHGAISESKLRTILETADLDSVRKLATPRASKQITPTMRSMAKHMSELGYTQKQIADRLGVSTSSVYNIVSAA